MPARFRFGLQPLLDQRKRLEEEKQYLCALRRRELEESLQELNHLVGALVACSKQMTNAADLACLDTAIQAQRRRASGLEATLEAARKELVAASRERRVIENLRTRRRRAYEREEARREELELDEANARRNRRVVP